MADKVPNLVKDFLGDDGKFELSDIPAFLSKFTGVIKPDKIDDVQEGLAKLAGNLNLGQLGKLAGGLFDKSDK